MTCQQELRKQGKAYPRTCEDCGLGPCNAGRKEIVVVTDRELLKLAALASGYACYRTNEAGGYEVKEHPMNEWVGWNPLTSDHDALRLAVKLGLGPHAGPFNATCESHDAPIVFEPIGTDPYAATRRAIVLAAAEIGRTV